MGVTLIISDLYQERSEQFRESYEQAERARAARFPAGRWEGSAENAAVRAIEAARDHGCLYRDSYGAGNLLNFFGLSWFGELDGRKLAVPQMGADVSLLTRSTQYHLLKFLEGPQGAISAERLAAWAAENPDAFAGERLGVENWAVYLANELAEGRRGLENWAVYFANEKESLIAFIRTAMDREEHITVYI